MHSSYDQSIDGGLATMERSTEQPRGQLSTRTPAMPADADPSGDIFGGWVLSEMDIAAGIRAGQRAQGVWPPPATDEGM